MSAEDPTEAKTPSPKPIPENKTAEKVAMETRRLRGYLTTFRHRVEALESLETLAQSLIAEPPLGMVGVDAYERRLNSWRLLLTYAIAEINRTREALAQQVPP